MDCGMVLRGMKDKTKCLLEKVKLFVFLQVTEDQIKPTEESSST